MSLFQKATRRRQPLRIALCGGSGSGKTMTSLRIATRLAEAEGSRIAMIDTEDGSSQLYAGEPNPDGGVLDFDVVDLRQAFGDFSVRNYLRALKAAEEAGYKVVVIDSGSHAWAGPGGVLEYKDRIADKKYKGNSFAAWKDATPEHHAFVEALLRYPGHVIMTMRVKVEYTKDDRGRPVKVGLQPVQRDGMEYEFTVVLDVDIDTHVVTVGKTRCSAIADKRYNKPGADLAEELLAWLDGGGSELAAPTTASAYDLAAALSGHGLTVEDAQAFASFKDWPDPASLPEARQRRFVETIAGEDLARFGDDLKRAFFARFRRQPTKTEHDGDADAWEAAKAAWDDERRAVMRAWWGIGSFGDARIRHAMSARGVAWLRECSDADFGAAIDEALDAERAA